MQFLFLVTSTVLPFPINMANIASMSCNEKKTNLSFLIYHYGSLVSPVLFIWRWNFEKVLTFCNRSYKVSEWCICFDIFCPELLWVFFSRSPPMESLTPIWFMRRFSLMIIDEPMWGKTHSSWHCVRKVRSTILFFVRCLAFHSRRVQGSITIIAVSHSGGGLF